MAVGVKESERSRIRECYMLQCSVRSQTSQIQEKKGKVGFILCLISMFLVIIHVSCDTYIFLLTLLFIATL